MKVNNVTRFLDAHNISYTAHTFPEKKLDALEVAEILGVPPEMVYKTIVAVRQGKGKPILAVVPGPSEVNLKALARAVGEKKVVIASQNEAERLTGLLAGGISPLALLNRGFQVVLEVTAQELSEFNISGGQRGLDICLSVADFIEIANARLAHIIT